MKAMLACDAVESKIVFPVAVMPKIDGVRGINTSGQMTARSLKRHKNVYTSGYFSAPEFLGIDGELAAEYETHADLCRLTTSATSTIEGESYLLWHAFDYLIPETVGIPYLERYDALRRYLISMWSQDKCQRVRLVPLYVVDTLFELLDWEDKFLNMGYEGLIIRNPLGKYKEGRSTVREGGLLRIKRFLDGEFLITELIEGQENKNAAQINERGLQYRSSHKENMVPNGQVGSLVGTVVADIFDPVYPESKLLEKGQLITVSPGTMDHNSRKVNWDNQINLIGRIGKFKFFPKGLKDKPRFPIFQGLRAEEDL